MASACIKQMSLGMVSQTTQYISKSTTKMQPIAPAPSRNSVLSMNSANILTESSAQSNGYKKKYTYANLPYGEQPPSVLRRNARERNRVKQVNNGFANLRQHIPQTIITALTNGGRGASKKLSKVDTLRLAVEYIRRLQDLVETVDGNSECNTSTSSLASSYIAQPIASPAGSTSSYYLDSSDEQHYQMQSYQNASSPTPSYSSDNSIASQPQYVLNGQVQFKYEPYENQYNVQQQVEDEELLDYISSWQEQ